MDQLSYRFLHEEFRQLATMTRVFPTIFLGVAAFLLNVVFTRLVGTQRDQVAILKAFPAVDFVFSVGFHRDIQVVAPNGTIYRVGHFLQPGVVRVLAATDVDGFVEGNFQFSTRWFCNGIYIYCTSKCSSAGQISSRFFIHAIVQAHIPESGRRAVFRLALEQVAGPVRFQVLVVWLLVLTVQVGAIGPFQQGMFCLAGFEQWRNSRLDQA